MVIEMPVQMDEKILRGHRVAKDFLREGRMELLFSQARQYTADVRCCQVDLFQDTGARHITVVKFSVPVTYIAGVSKHGSNIMAQIAREMECQITSRVGNPAINDP